jgi:hypothetical protein
MIGVGGTLLQIDPDGAASVRQGRLLAQASQAAEKLQNCHPEGRVCPRDLLFFLAIAKKQIPRCTRDDKIDYFFRSLFSVRGLGLARTDFHRLKPVPLLRNPPDRLLVV